MKPLTRLKAIPFTAFCLFSLRVLFMDSFHPLCQSRNRGDMDQSSDEEETFKFLIEKCDIYDHIDAILDLKDKYTLYELEQIKKEWNIKNMKISVENLEKYRDKYVNKKI